MPARETNTRATWGSHVPINKAILETTNIKGVMELGIGYNSTPSLFESSPYVVGIENDLKWINEMRDSGSIAEDNNHKIIHHELPPKVSRSSRRHEFGDSFFADVRAFYDKYYSTKTNMIFVDCYSCCRYEALLHLSKKSVDVITFHDYQLPNGLKNHYNGGVEDVVPDKFDFYIDKTYTQHTGIWIRKKFTHDIDQIIEATRKHADEWIPGSGKNVNIVKVK